MLVDEGDELVVGSTEYIVLKKYTADNKEYVFVADSKAPDVNIAENFDPEAIKLLMLSQEANESVVSNNTAENNSSYNDTFGNNIGNSKNDNVMNTPAVEDDNVIKSNMKNSGKFKVEKDKSLIEKILTFMFMG